MNSHYIKAILHSFSLCLFFISCEKNNMQASVKYSDKEEQQFFQQVISFDTLGVPQRKNLISKEIQNLNRAHKQDGRYYFFKGKLAYYNQQKDSAIYYFDKIEAENSKEMKYVKDYNLFTVTTFSDAVADAGFMKKALDVTKKAEKDKSIFTYKFYDIIAHSYFNNRNAKKSLEYAELHFQNHPLKNSPKIQQYFYDVSFLLSAELKDLKKMKYFHKKSFELATKLKDDYFLMRTYDFEARIFAMEERWEKSLESSKKNYLLSKKQNHIFPYMIGNLGESFQNNNEHDSAIYYFKKAIELDAEVHTKLSLAGIYSNLSNSYKAKNDFKNAMIALDSSNTINLRNQNKKQEETIAELEKKYQVEKKDFEITSLKTNNVFNEKIIRQQRWLFAGIAFLLFGLMLYLYNLYRQKLLKEKNKSLESENKKLLLEQKALQLQLNPHFIYNSIANLQGLITQGKNEKTVSYLSSFSRLLRNILELNREDFIPLEDEISSISNYMTLQQMRFENLFDYEIHVSENCDKEFVMIPPMLLQPFIENSIEHGFKDISYKGKIDISFTKNDRKLIVEIKDNGTGINEKIIKNANKKSLSRIIIQERLDVLFNQKNKESYLEVISPNKNNDPGVLVKIVLPLIED